MTFRIPHSALRILVALWRLNLAEELQYRANFVASVLGTLFWIVTALLTLAVFFSHTTRLGGWDYWEVVVLLGVFNALTGVIEAVLRPGIGWLARCAAGASISCSRSRWTPRGSSRSGGSTSGGSRTSCLGSLWRATRSTGWAARHRSPNLRLSPWRLRLRRSSCTPSGSC